MSLIHIICTWTRNKTFNDFFNLNSHTVWGNFFWNRSKRFLIVITWTRWLWNSSISQSSFKCTTRYINQRWFLWICSRTRCLRFDSIISFSNTTNSFIYCVYTSILVIKVYLLYLNYKYLVQVHHFFMD